MKKRESIPKKVLLWKEGLQEIFWFHLILQCKLTKQGMWKNFNEGGVSERFSSFLPLAYKLSP